MLSVAEAREVVLGAVAGPLPAETVPVDGALDRVLAAAVTAAGDVPPFPNSAMDGFAALPGPAGRVLRVAGESRAGAPAREPVREGEAIRISTGAVLPDGGPAVIRVEDTTEREDGTVELREALVAGDNARGAGDDVRAGELVLGAGTTLGPVELGAAIGAGVGELACARRPRIAILATGDELRPPGEPLGPGEIHNSNEPMLAALGARAGAEVVTRGRVGDDRARTESALGAALDVADVLVVSGGVSVGPHDHVKPALDALGVEERFWRVALQPGKPTWFGTREGRWVLGLPGNPVSAVVCFVLFARPLLRALQGATPVLPPRRDVRLDPPVPRRAEREQAVRVTLEGDVATVTGAQPSHRLTSLVGAEALAFVAPGPGEATTAEIEPL